MAILIFVIDILLVPISVKLLMSIRRQNDCCTLCSQLYPFITILWSCESFSLRIAAPFFKFRRTDKLEIAVFFWVLGKP